MSIIGSFLPHAFHLCRTWLEVPKVLLPQPWFLVDLNAVSWERTRARLVAGKGREYAFGGLAGAAVGGRKEVQGVVCTQERAQALAGFMGLGTPFGGELYTVVGDGLVDVSVFLGLLAMGILCAKGRWERKTRTVAL